MTDEDLKREVHELAGRVEELEDERERLKKLPESVARLEGALATLTRVVNSRFDTVDKGVSKAASFDTILKLAAGILVPLLVALVAGYFGLKAATIHSNPNPNPPAHVTK